MARSLPPLVYRIGGDGRSLTVAASQHVDFAGAVRVAPSQAAQYKVVSPLVADAERRAAAFSRESKPEEVKRAARVVNAEPNPAALRDYVAWVVEARRDFEQWNPAAPNRDDSRSPSALLEEHRRQQQRALDSGADARIIDGIELKPPAGGLARDAERRLLQAVLAGQQVRITA